MLTPQEIEIANARSNGAILQTIAKEQGKDISNISRKLQKPELKAYLERIQTETIEANAKITADNITYLISNYKNNPCTNEKERIEKSHGARVTERMAENIGILPSRTPSIMIQYMSNNTIINNDVNGILDKLYGQAEVIEVEDRPCEVRYEEADMLPDEA